MAEMSSKKKESMTILITLLLEMEKLVGRVQLQLRIRWHWFAIRAETTTEDALTASVYCWRRRLNDRVKTFRTRDHFISPASEFDGGVKSRSR